MEETQAGAWDTSIPGLLVVRIDLSKGPSVSVPPSRIEIAASSAPEEEP
jgi:hypothetical protein